MSKIGWLQRPGTTPESWNPIRARYEGRVGWHCVKCAVGCTNCYAAQQNKLGLRGGTRQEYRADSKAEVYLDETVLEAPLHWRDPRTIFPCSMSDLFGEWVRADAIRKVLDIMRRCPQHTFLMLTKRPCRMIDRVTVWPDVTPNMWAGVSISTQADAEENINLMVDLIGPVVRWVSYEPALEAVDFKQWFWLDDAMTRPAPMFDWLVLGGESGPNHRTLNIDHVASAVAQCRAAGVPVFVKQDSGPFPGKQGRIPDELWIQEWPHAASDD